MRFVRCSLAGRSRFGIVEGSEVFGFPEHVDSLEAYLAVPPGERGSLATESLGALESVSLLAPVRPHKNVFCVGRNYLGHAEEVARARGIELKLPPVPTFFTKAPTAIVGPGATIHLSAAISEQFDYEAELAVVIGTRCRDVAESDALSVVFGYTCLNDVTARDVQKDHQQWFKGKSLDETCPIGPWIVSAGDVADPHALDISMHVDGVVKQASNTNQLIFNIPRIIASLSAGMTLEPGDVIATGTPDGVGFARTPPEFLADGATMDVTIEKIGTLRNTIALAPKA